MSTRALRRLQKEQELEKQLAASPEEEEDSEVEDEGADTTAVQKPRNAFDMLEGMDEDSEEDVSDVEEPAPKPAPRTEPSQASKPKKKKKKAKKKAKGKAEPTVTPEPEEDEVDRALRELSLKNGIPSQLEEYIPNDSAVSASQLLAIDPKHLNPTNEMRSLFGNIALDDTDRSRSRDQRRREVNQQGGVDMATALTGRYSIASRGKELGALATRRNVFMQGRGDWPLATSGGLSMERTSETKQYNILHNQAYRDTQNQFRICVESMQPESMIHLLNVNPYHIATLLQVSEIAKHQGDHSISGDLLERALFNFGRSVHSTFPAALREGTARLPFNNVRNRELYLNIWRYVRNLEMRGTWRTAFEWTKILYQFDPVSDPFGATLMIDQLALRGRQHAALIEMCAEDAYGGMWTHLPNIQISLALAYLKSSQPKLARQRLAMAMHKYPSVLSRLASALDIEPLPSNLWGKLPSTDPEKLYTELYALRAKELWNMPEATALLVEVAETMSHYSDIIKKLPAPPPLEISLEEARHIMLLEIPQLIALLPRRFTNMPTSSSDVLPPPGEQSDFTARAPGDASGASALQTLFNGAAQAAGAPLNGVGGMLNRILDWFHRPAGPGQADDTDGADALRDLQAQLGHDVPPEVLQELLQIHDGDGGPPVAVAIGNDTGDFDYYLERADASDDTESLPDLESLPGNDRRERHPHAATVEEDEDDIEASSTRATTSGRAVLRHVESDDEEDDHDSHVISRGISMEHPEPTHTIYAPRNTRAHTPIASAPGAAAEPGTLDLNDTQRVQRWLLTSGLEELKQDTTTLGDYVGKLKIMPKRQQEWLLNMIRQREGKEFVSTIEGRLN